MNVVVVVYDEACRLACIGAVETFDACRLEAAVEGCGTKEGGSSECCGAGGPLDLAPCIGEGGPGARRLDKAGDA